MPAVHGREREEKPGIHTRLGALERVVASRPNRSLIIDHALRHHHSRNTENPRQGTAGQKTEAAMFGNRFGLYLEICSVCVSL